MTLSTGKSYLERLRDGRKIWLGGVTIEDVTAAPATAPVAREIAALYDLQHDPESTDILTVQTNSDQCGRAFVPPRMPEELVARREGYTAWARTTLGMLGRSPDYMATALTAFASAHSFFAVRDNHRFADNLVDYHRYARDNDLCLTHTFAGPRVDRSKPISALGADGRLALGIIDETSDGPIVSGMRNLATLAPLADELVVFGAGYPLLEGEEHHAISFAIPIDTPGLQFICREPFSHPNRADHPLASRFDEMDCVAIFENVVVPWERVFVYKDRELDQQFKAETYFNEHVGQQVLARQSIKIELMLAVAHSIAESAGLSQFLNVQHRLGEVVTHLDTLRACLRAAEADAEATYQDVLAPASKPLFAGLRLGQTGYGAVTEVLRDVAASGLVMTPASGDLDGPLSAAIDRYYQGAGLGGRDRVALYRLAWDLVGDAFGTRQALFERFFLGDPARAYSAAYRRQDKQPLAALVDRALEPRTSRKGEDA